MKPIASRKVAPPLAGAAINAPLVLAMKDGKRYYLTTKPVSKDGKVVATYISDLSEPGATADAVILPAEIDRESFTVEEATPEELIEGIEAGRRSVGTPEDVARSVERWQDAGATQLIFGVLNNTLPVEVAIESVETFGREVVPAFDTDPLHSTTRQREAQVGG